MFSKFFSSINLSDDKDRLRSTIGILFCALIAGMLLSWKLWMTERNFPLTPLFHLPEFSKNASIDILALILLLASALVIFPSQRKLSIALLLLFILEFLGDQNRWQPWCYQYFLMLFLIIFHQTENSKSSALTLNAFRLIICGIYCWSGIQKLNPEFRATTADWLTQPLGNYFGNSFALYCGKAAQIIPFVEIFLAFGLLYIRTRKIALWTAICMHAYIILLMTPLGRNYNYVIIPWNIAMICFLLLLFKNVKNVSIASVFSTIKTKYIIPIFILVWILPAFSLFGKWPSYLSASLYSGNSDNGYIYISKKIKDTLPTEINEMVHTQQDTLFYIYINEWSIKELQAPTYPETSVFLSARNLFYKYAKDSDDVRLLVERKFTLLEKDHYEYVK